MQVLYLILFVLALAALPWLGVKFGGRLLIVGLAVAELLAIMGFAWSLRAADIAACGSDDLCISEMAGWHDRIGVLPVLLLLGIVGVSAYVASALKTTQNDSSELRKAAH